MKKAILLVVALLALALMLLLLSISAASVPIPHPDCSNILQQSEGRPPSPGQLQAYNACMAPRYAVLNGIADGTFRVEVAVGLVFSALLLLLSLAKWDRLNPALRFPFGQIVKPILLAVFGCSFAIFLVLLTANVYDATGFGFALATYLDGGTYVGNVGALAFEWLAIATTALCLFQVEKGALRAVVSTFKWFLFPVVFLFEVYLSQVMASTPWEMSEQVIKPLSWLVVNVGGSTGHFPVFLASNWTVLVASGVMVAVTLSDWLIRKGRAML